MNGFCSYLKRVALSALLPTLALTISSTAQTFEDWQIAEIFSNADGSIQYIRLSTTSASQHNLQGRSLRALDASGSPGQTFTFGSNLGSSQTANRSVLIGTTAFSQASGLSVDYVLPSGFLFTTGGSVELTGVDSLSYTRTQLPRNGFQALRGDGSAGTAMPENFAGSGDTLALDVLSRFDAGTAVVNLPVVDVPGMGAVDVSMQLTNDNPIEFTLSEAHIYGSGIVAGDRAARFQNGGVLYIPAVIVGNEQYELNMTLISEDPVRFGNLAVLNVIDISPDPDPDPAPDPDPTPDPQAESIAAGANSYSQLCASCHGPSGGGTGQAPNLTAQSSTPFNTLRLYINNNMPFGNAGACVDSSSSSCATDIANFIRNNFSATVQEGQ